MVDFDWNKTQYVEVSQIWALLNETIERMFVWHLLWVFKELGHQSVFVFIMAINDVKT